MITIIKNKPKTITVTLLLATLLWMSGVTPAFAHGRIEVGPYTIIIGWRDEPNVVGEPNAITIEVSEGDQPVIGLESSLDVEVVYAGRIYRGNLELSDEPGVYQVKIMPTVRGQYSVRLVGAIGDLEIDEFIDPEEVLPAAVLEFPESRPDPLKMQEQLEALEARLQTAYYLAIAGVVLGLAGVGVAVFGILRGRSKSE